MKKSAKFSDIASHVVCTNLIQFERVFDDGIRVLPIDLVGEVINVPSQITVVENHGSVPNKIKLIRFSLQDLSGFIIDCVAYNELAHYLVSMFWASKFWDTMNKPIVALLKSWRVSYDSEGKRMEVITDPTVSRIYFDPKCPEAEDFKWRLTLKNLDSAADSDD